MCIIYLTSVLQVLNFDVPLPVGRNAVVVKVVVVVAAVHSKLKANLCKTSPSYASSLCFCGTFFSLPLTLSLRLHALTGSRYIGRYPMVRYSTILGKPRRSSRAARIEIVTPQTETAAEDAPSQEQHRSAQVVVRQFMLPSEIPAVCAIEDDARRAAGLVKMRRCRLCLLFFPETSLKGCISQKAILEQRARWGLAHLQPRDLASGSLYAPQRLCAFCIQFFDEGVMALDDDLDMWSTHRTRPSGVGATADVLDIIEAEISSSPSSPTDRSDRAVSPPRMAHEPLTHVTPLSSAALCPSDTAQHSATTLPRDCC